jgi:hypothetical protein
MTAREAHILPGLAHSLLLSIGKLCDAECEAKFNNQQRLITKNDTKTIPNYYEDNTAVEVDYGAFP